MKRPEKEALDDGLDVEDGLHIFYLDGCRAALFIIHTQKKSALFTLPKIHRPPLGGASKNSGARQTDRQAGVCRENR